MEQDIFIRIIEIKSLDELFNSFLLNGKYFELSKNCIFRGESKKEYLLQPSVLRERIINQLLREKPHSEFHFIEEEYKIISDFYRIANQCGLYVPFESRCFDHIAHNIDLVHINKFFKEERWLPKDLYEIAALTQHYGLPTRLLDWTTSWKTALYFASSRSLYHTSEDQSSHFVLWALDILHSDYSIENPDYPLKIIRPRYVNNENLRAQKGLFTLWEIEKPYINNNCKTAEERYEADKKMFRKIDNTPLDILLNNEITYYFEKYKITNPKIPAIYKFLIPSSFNKEVFTQLFYDGINASTLFPGYYGVKRAVEEMNLIDNNHRFRL